jgi:drug/metabolite transporter (DMT)-like permease
MSSSPVSPAPTGPPVSPAGSDLPLWLRLSPLTFLLLWASGYTGVRVAVEGTGPVFLLAVRYIGVLIVLVPLWLWLRPPLPKTRSAWLHLIVVGALIQGVYFCLTNIAIGLEVSAAVLGIILGLQPILVALLAPRLAGERVDLKAWIGLLLGLAGAAIVVLARAGEGGASSFAATGWQGLAVTVAALVFITAGTLWEKRFGSPQHPVTASLVQCSVALAMALPLALAVEDCRINWSVPFVTAVAYLVIGNSIIAMSLLFAMIQRGAASRVSALLFLVPPTSAVIAWIVIGEPVPRLAWPGMAIAAFGVALVGGPFSRR